MFRTNCGRTVGMNCYMCIEETVCKKCGWAFHPLETSVCVNSLCNEVKLEHPLYCMPKNCQNSDCLFYQMAKRAEICENKNICMTQ